MTNVILVDDHDLFRIGLKISITSKYPDICIAGEADCGAALFRLLETVTPDIILLDIMLPDITGVEIARRLKKDFPSIKILAISAESADEIVQAMLNINIEGFIGKRRGNVDEVVQAIRTIMNGFEYYGNDIAAIMYKIYVAKKNTAEAKLEFTEQERRIIELCRDGLKGNQIADRLNISTRTVNNHKNNIFRKLGINSTIEMVQYAQKNGIIRMD